MLSIIVSSASAEIYAAFERNILETIGSVPYELIRIENEAGHTGICEAYNTAAQKANFSYVCFVHEDVAFLSAGWGSKLIKHLQTPGAGIIGLAGSVYKSGMLNGWWENVSNKTELLRMNILQQYKYVQKPQKLKYANPNNETLAHVVVVDGIFLAMEAQVWRNNPFDQNLLKGFHGYDLDISLSVGMQRKNYVALDIPVRHFSEGKRDIRWVYNLLKIHLKWRKSLPRSTDHNCKPDDNYKEIFFYATSACKMMILDGISYPGLIKHYGQLLKLLTIKAKDCIFMVMPLVKSFVFINYFFFKIRLAGKHK